MPTGPAAWIIYTVGCAVFAGILYAILTPLRRNKNVGCESTEGGRA